MDAHTDNENKSPDENLDDLMKARRDHLQALIAKGVVPFASSVKRTHTSTEARALWEKHKDAWGATPGAPVKESQEVTLTGRIVALRSHGGATFIDLQDGFGTMQVLAQESVLKDEYQLWFLFDLGDFIEVTGQLFVTKRGEVTLNTQKCVFLTKTMRPLPDKWHGLEDKEKRYRERYADLIANDEVRERFRLRTRVVQQIRQDLEENDFLEVETPILQSLAGGATAKPFITHYNAYDTDVYLRVAPELYHKRLIVGGFERVYEFAKVFRNEGVDHSHNPEFTDLEFYAAYWDYQQMMDFTGQLLRNAVKAAHGKLQFIYAEHEIDFSQPFERVSFADAIKKACNIAIYEETEASLREKMRELGVDAPKGADFGKLCDYLYKAKVRPNLIQPTFLVDHPIELSPLAKKKNDREVQRFQVIVAGQFELCNAFTELNDPNDQKNRFLAQVELKKRGDDEAQEYDADYIKALEYGMPPTAGFGMGIDRLITLLTNSQTLREIILFPFMRPKENES